MLGFPLIYTSILCWDHIAFIIITPEFPCHPWSFPKEAHFNQEAHTGVTKYASILNCYHSIFQQEGEVLIDYRGLISSNFRRNNSTYLTPSCTRLSQAAAASLISSCFLVLVKDALTCHSCPSTLLCPLNNNPPREKHDTWPNSFLYGLCAPRSQKLLITCWGSWLLSACYHPIILAHHIHSCRMCTKTVREDAQYLLAVEPPSPAFIFPSFYTMSLSPGFS